MDVTQAIEAANKLLKWVIYGLLTVMILMVIYFAIDNVGRKERLKQEEIERKEADRRALQFEQKRRAEVARKETLEQAAEREASNQRWQKQMLREETARHIGTLTTMAQRFADQQQIASSTPRIALAPMVQQMQTTARLTAALPVTGCMQVAQAHLAAGMNEVVIAYLAFMRQENTSPAASSAAFRLEAYRTQMDACAKVAQ